MKDNVNVTIYFCLFCSALLLLPCSLSPLLQAQLNMVDITMLLLPQLLTTLQLLKSMPQNQLPIQNTPSTMASRTHIPETSNLKLKNVMEMSSRDNTLWSNQTVQSVPLNTQLMITMVSTQ